MRRKVRSVLTLTSRAVWSPVDSIRLNRCGLNYTFQMEVEVITIGNVKQVRDWTRNVVYVGRAMQTGNARLQEGSVLGNPFRVGQDGTRTEVIEKFRRWLWVCCKNENSKVRKELMRLVEKHKRGENIVLVCWCHPAPCHADVIKRAIEYFADPESKPHDVQKRETQGKPAFKPSRHYNQVKFYLGPGRWTWIDREPTRPGLMREHRAYNPKAAASPRQLTIEDFVAKYYPEAKGGD